MVNLPSWLAEEWRRYLDAGYHCWRSVENRMTLALPSGPPTIVDDGAAQLGHTIGERDFNIRDGSRRGSDPTTRIGEQIVVWT
jgi:hypothetical protein